MEISLRVNGEEVSAAVEPQELLLDLLRDRLGLTGAKRSCDVQVCGACTVLLDGQPVSACCTLAWEARGRDMLTIEGLAAELLGGVHARERATDDARALDGGLGHASSRTASRIPL